MSEPVQRLRCTASCATDVGRVRSVNEDAFLDRSDIGLWVVADGMGGHEAGDFASQMIVERLSRIGPPADAATFLSDVREGILDAHRALRREMEQRGTGKVIGSTVVALMAWGGYFACLWAGDSRLYLLRRGGLRQVTRDHSLVQDLVEAGSLSPEDAESHPHANVVTRAVGAGSELDLDKRHEKLEEGDVLLLCSDGLSRKASDVEIADLLAVDDSAEATRRLIDLALDRGAPDNVTVIVVRCRSEAELGDAGAGFPADDAAPSDDPEAMTLSGRRIDSDHTIPGAGGGTDPDDPLAIILADGPADRETGSQQTDRDDPRGQDLNEEGRGSASLSPGEERGRTGKDRGTGLFGWLRSAGRQRKP